MSSKNRQQLKRETCRSLDEDEASDSGSDLMVPPAKKRKKTLKATISSGDSNSNSNNKTKNSTNDDEKDKSKSKTSNKTKSKSTLFKYVDEPFINIYY